MNREQEQMARAIADAGQDYLSDLVSRVLAREDAADALDYVLSIPEGGPSCGCGAWHWSCDFGDEDEEEADECAICVPGQCPGPDCPGNYSDDQEG